MFTNRYRFLFAFVLSLYTYINTVLCQLYFYFKLDIEWFYAFCTIAVITFGTLEINRLLEIPLRKILQGQQSLIRSKIIFFLVGCMASSLLTVAIVMVVGMGLHHYSFKQTLVPIKLNLIYCSLLNLLYHLIDAIIFYFKEYNRSKLETEEFKTATAQAEVQLIKSQINPHFLFNNLNVLAALILKDNTEANKFIEEFSKVYRYILTNHDKELVELKTELEFIKPYIFLLQKRFAQGIAIHIQVEENDYKRLIIPASLQMLIENAIKHNIVSKNKPLCIDIYTDRGNAIIVSNNLQQKQTVESSTGIGLQNIIKRYSLVSNKLVNVDRTQSNFLVSLPLINSN